MNTSNIDKRAEEIIILTENKNKLEAALEFLHNCLGNKPQNLTDLNRVFDEKQTSSLLLSFGKFKPESPETLIEFRDKLLALVKS